MVGGWVVGGWVGGWVRERVSECVYQIHRGTLLCVCVRARASAYVRASAWMRAKKVGAFVSIVVEEGFETLTALCVCVCVRACVMFVCVCVCVCVWQIVGAFVSIVLEEGFSGLFLGAAHRMVCLSLSFSWCRS